MSWLRALFNGKPKRKQRPRGMRALLLEGAELVERADFVSSSPLVQWCRKVRAVVK